jgi:hypothetical protein
MSLLLLLRSAAPGGSTRTLVVGGYPAAAGHLVVGLNGLFGYLGASIPATGDDGTSPLANDGIGAGDEYLWRITGLPATGTVDADDVGAFLHTSPVGTNTTTYSAYIIRASTGAYEVLAGQTITTSGADASGALSVTLGALTLASTSTLQLRASLVADLSTMTTASASGVLIDGEMPAGQLGTLTLSSAATLGNTGTLSQTLDNVTLESAAVIVAGGSGVLSATLDALTLESTSTLLLQGSLGVDLGTMTTESASVILIDGEMPAGQLGTLTIGSAAAVALAGTLGVTLEDAGLVATGVLTTGRVGTVDATLDALTLVSTGELGPAPEVPEVPSGRRRDFVKPWMPEIQGELAATLDGVRLKARGKAGKQKVRAIAASRLEGLTLKATGVGAVSVGGMWRTAPRPALKRGSLEDRVAYLESLLTRSNHHV